MSDVVRYVISDSSGNILRSGWAPEALVALQVAPQLPAADQSPLVAETGAEINDVEMVLNPFEGGLAWKNAPEDVVFSVRSPDDF